MAVRSLRAPARPLKPHADQDRPLRPIEQARARREHLPYYLDLHPAIRFLLAVALVCVVSLLYLMQTSRVASENYRLQAAESRHTDLMRENQRIQLEIANLRSLTRIEDIARHKLGMVPIGNGYLYVQVPVDNNAVAVGTPVGQASGSPPPVVVGSNP
jgi:cell division protein FtsL